MLPGGALLLVGGFGRIVLLALRLGDVLVTLPRPLVGIGGAVRVGGVLRAFRRIGRPNVQRRAFMPASARR